MNKFALYTFILLGNILIGCSKTTNYTSKLNADNNNLLLFAGTYSNKINGDTGVFVYMFDTITADFEKISGVKNIVNPSYLHLSKKNNKLYAVSEGGKNGNLANTLVFNRNDSSLNIINSFKTEGEDPCFIITDNDEKILATANYSGSSISLFSLKDGIIESLIRTIGFKGEGVIKSRQEKSHLHNIIFSPDNKYFFATDLGTDKIYRIRVNSALFDKNVNPDIDSIDVKPGSGPRHLAFGKDFKHLYLITELSGEINVFSFEDNNLNNIQTIAADTTNAQGSADIHITNNGKYLYASHRLKNDGISIFKILDDGRIENIGYVNTGKHPRNFVISPNDKYLLAACRDDNMVEIFSINQETGMLEKTNKQIQLGSPVCLKFGF
ncbi:MAG: lactonase family protein [Bacteroidales bacterium]|nr:lactonase family protein [Bacteroidales bacterium]